VGETHVWTIREDNKPALSEHFPEVLQPSVIVFEEEYLQDNMRNIGFIFRKLQRYGGRTVRISSLLFVLKARRPSTRVIGGIDVL
jgi:hypothetical protein